MTDTPNLALPYILAAQAQKHVTHNEALRALDCIIQLSVLDRTLTSPPPSPTSGSRYIVAAGGSGAWAGRDDQVAAYQDGAWAYFTPREGWLAWVAGENSLLVYAADTWSAVPGGGGEGGVSDHGLLSGLGDDDHAQYHNNARGDARYMPLAPENVGINATADSTNRLAIKSEASLFDNEGAGHQQKINKKSTIDAASQLYQTNYSGRAEIGLTGDDNFHFKVSANGSTWKDAIQIDRSSGVVTTPFTPTLTKQIFLSSGTWSKPAGCKFIKASIQGGGGGGGSSQLASASNGGCGGGGASGGHVIKYLDVTSISSLTVTVGAGGTAGAAGVAGSGGGTSGLGPSHTYGKADGGGGGSGTAAGANGVYTAGGGLPGTASNGDLNNGGNGGGAGFMVATNQGLGGEGGSSSFGGAARPNRLFSNGSVLAGSAATGYGSGGSGGISCTSTSEAVGGAGAAGIVVIEEFY